MSREIHIVSFGQAFLFKKRLVGIPLASILKSKRLNTCFSKIEYQNQKGDFMEFLKSKKAFVTHPVMLFVFGVVLGLVLAYVWVNYINLANPFCP